MTTPICTHTLSPVQQTVKFVQANNRPRSSYQPVTSINPANLYNNAFQPIRQSVIQHLPYPVPVNTYSAADAYQRSY